MEHMETGSIVLAALSSIWAIVGTVLLFRKKLRPVGRKHPDRPQLWVPVGFYTYTFIHWMMVYGYWAASHFPEHNASLSFDPVSRGITEMASQSLHQLNHFEGVKISGPIIKMTQKQIEEHVVAGIRLNDFVAHVDDFNSKIDATQQSLNVLFGDLVDKTCKNGLPVSSISMTRQMKTFSQLTKSIRTNSKEKRFESIAGEMVGAFGAEKLSNLGTKGMQQSLKDKKGVLTHFMVDMNNMDKNGNALIKKLRPKITNKIRWIHQVTFYEIFVTLAISFFILIGFGRVESLMSARWPTRLTAFSIPLAAINILFFAGFIGLMASFECPKETETINLDRFTTTWKPKFSNSAASKICTNAKPTLFSGIDDQTSISKNEIANHFKDDIEKTGLALQQRKIDNEELLKGMEDMRRIANGTRTTGDEKCLGNLESSKLAEIVAKLDNFLEECENFEKAITIFNGHLDRGTANLEPLINTFYEDAGTAIEVAMEEAKARINSADIACDTIKSRVENGKKLVCTHLDVQLDELWLVLDVVMVFLVGLFSLNIVVYRTIALWEIEFHGPKPLPPQPAARVLRRHRPRRLNAHIF